MNCLQFSGDETKTSSILGKHSNRTGRLLLLLMDDNRNSNSNSSVINNNGEKAPSQNGTEKNDMKQSNECKESPQRNVDDKREGQMTCEAEKRQWGKIGFQAKTGPSIHH